MDCVLYHKMEIYTNGIYLIINQDLERLEYKKFSSKERDSEKLKVYKMLRKFPVQQIIQLSCYKLEKYLHGESIKRNLEDKETQLLH